MLETQAKPAKQAKVHSPLERTITSLQVKRLSALTGIDAGHLKGKTLGDIAKVHQWEVDPELFLMRQVCGRVVKKDPATGIEYPVPYATVNVYDTEDELWGYFPRNWPWSWLFPIDIREELLTTVTADHCGEFCCWIPAFDIDWIVQWRNERVCIPDYLKVPSVADLLAQLGPQATVHGPGPVNPPDPGPLLQIAAQRADVAAVVGKPTQQVLKAYSNGSATFGAPMTTLSDVLRSPAFGSRLVPPPVSHLAVKGARSNGHAAALMEKMGISAEKFQKIDFSKYIGPFLRCEDHWVPEWYPIIEAPDINFTVTENINGNEVVIYDGNFDLPVGIYPVPDVTLEVSQVAVASPACECAPDLPCTTTPQIEMIGLVRATPSYIDATTGLSVRTEPPKNGGVSTGTPYYPATSPFCGELQFYGCVHIPGAAYYRLLAEYAPGSGIPSPGPYTATGPVVSHWPVFPQGAPTQTVTCDADGWYQVQLDTTLPSHLLLDWYGLADGTYRLTLQVADSSKNVISTGAPFVFTYDDSAPLAQFTSLGYTVGTASGTPTPLGLACAQIFRTPGEAVYVHAAAVASSPHLRSAAMGASGCGSGTPIGSSGTVDWWYENATDTSAALNGTFMIPADAPAGCYTMSLTAVSRAFSPSGADGSFGSDWWNDETTWRYVNVPVTVSVVDA